MRTQGRVKALLIGSMLAATTGACGEAVEESAPKAWEVGIGDAEGDGHAVEEPANPAPPRPDPVSPDPVSPDPVSPDPVSPGPVEPPAQRASCEAPYAERWSRRSFRGFAFNPDFVGWTPDGSMYVESGGYPRQAVAYRHADAKDYFGDQGMIIDVSDDWSRYVTSNANDYEPRVVSRPDGVELLIVREEHLYRLDDTARISADGSHLAVLRCGPEGARLGWWAVDDGVELHSVDLDAHCSAEHVLHRPQLELTADGRHALVGLGDQGSLYAVDLHEGGIVGRVAAHEGEILALALAPDDGRVATTGTDGVLRIWDVPALTPTTSAASQRSVGVFETNHMTYLPFFWVSPVAWSPDGRILAFVGEDGAVRMLEDEQLRTEALRVPRVDHQSVEFPDAVDAPAQLRFSPDGRSLAVSYDYSVGIYGCDDAPTLPDATLGVSVEGPTRIARHNTNPARFEGRVQVDSSAPFVGLRLTVDDQHALYYTPFDDGALRWSTTEVGEHALIVEAFDGSATGRSVFDLTVE